MGLAYPLHALRLGLLLRPQDIRLPFAELHRITWISVFFGSFTPGGVGGDLSRLLHVIGRVPENKPGAAVAILADRLLGLLTLLLIASIALVFHQLSARVPAREIVALLPLFAGTFVLLAGAWILAASSTGGVMFGRLVGEERTQALRQAARQSIQPPSALLSAALVSLAIWLADFCAGWVLARALGWPVGFVEISVALAVAYTVASLPFSVGGHGVREGALIIVLGWFGLASGAPLLAVAFLALTLLWCLVGGVCYFVSRPALLAGKA